MSEADAVQRTTRGLITIDSFADDLRQLGLKSGATVLVHSSLSALGWVCGGPETVIQSLLDVLGPDGTLMMPAHTADRSDPGQWQDPPVPSEWWDGIRRHMPPFDPALTPTRGMGVIAEAFRSYPGVCRSAHPQVSFCACGPQAAALTDGHALANSLGETSPLARLYDADGQVLLLGVGHANNTSLHLAEYRADFAKKNSVIDAAPILVDGRRVWQTFANVDIDSDDFDRLGQAYQAEHPEAVRQGPVGSGQGRLLHQRPLVDYAVGWLAHNRR